MIFYSLQKDFSIKITEDPTDLDIKNSTQNSTLFPTFYHNGQTISITFDNQTGWFTIIISLDSQEGHIHTSYCHHYDDIKWLFDYYVRKSLNIL